MYYRFTNPLQIQPDEGYPQSLSTWSDSLTSVSAAFQYKTRKTYFFVRNLYYEFNDASFEVR